MKRYRLTENRLRNIISESVRGILSELDWKTYMNAARKRDERGSYKAASELEKYAQQMFQKQHGKNGHSYNYEYDLPTSYQGRHHRWKDGESWASDYDFDVKAPTEEGWWNGEYADTKRSYRYGNGFPHRNYGELHDDTFDYAANNKEGWDGSQHRRHTMIYDKDGERYYPDSSSVGNEISLSKDDDYNARQRRMAQDMEDYYTGKSHYINGKGWARKDESFNRRTDRIVKESIRKAITESVGDWNEGMFREDLMSYLKANRDYDGSAGASNGRSRLLSAVCGDLPWEINSNRFCYFLTLQPQMDLEKTVENCVNWVYTQLSQNKKPRVVW